MKIFSSEISKMNSLLNTTVFMGMCMCCRLIFQNIVGIYVIVAKIYLSSSEFRKSFFFEIKQNTNE